MPGNAANKSARAEPRHADYESAPTLMLMQRDFDAFAEAAKPKAALRKLMARR